METEIPEKGAEQIKEIACCCCGYIDKAEKFQDMDKPNFKEAMRKLGLDLNNPADRGVLQASYAGAVCPICGSFDINIDPNSKDQK